MSWDWAGSSISDSDQRDWLLARRATARPMLDCVDRTIRVEIPALRPIRWQSDAQHRYRDRLAELERELECIRWHLEGAIDAMDRSLSVLAARPLGVTG